MHVYVPEGINVLFGLLLLLVISHRQARPRVLPQLLPL